jgi:transcriptional regulator with XRE-family HTH domain
MVRLAYSAMSSLQDRFQQAMRGPPKISQKALADACGVRGPTVWAWVKGSAETLKGENLLAASRFLNVSPRWLAEGKGPMRPKSGTDTALEQRVGERLHSYAVRLDPAILSDTLYWVDIEEAHGPAYRAGELLARIAELYAMHESEPGGRLSGEQHRRLLSAAERRTGDKRNVKGSKRG